MSQPEIIQLGAQQGVTVAEASTDASGYVAFTRDGAQIEAHVYKALAPEVALVGARVCLVALLQGEEPTSAHVLMVDDEYWGRRIQPASFRTGSFGEQFVMGYRLKGKILNNDEPVENANVSLEGTLVDAEGNAATFWDSLEYNELVYSSELETYVEGALVYAPIRTNSSGEFSFMAPKGHGAVYQRETDYRDDTPQTAQQPLLRYLQGINAAYLGRKAELVEGQEAEINIRSGTLTVTGTPGALLRIGTLDDVGNTYLVPPSGVVTVTQLPAGSHSIVQFKRKPWGEWDATWGCPREIAQVKPGETTPVTMAAMEYYDVADGIVAGRVYQRMGIPAGGIDIIAIDWETCEIAGTVTTTDGDGYWEAEIPEEGFGGDLWIHDASSGSVPIKGFPYSDVVLCARAYSGFSEMWKPEAWRKKDRGHKNFQYVPEAIRVQSRETLEFYETTEAEYGGWQTIAPLSAFQYVPDLEYLFFHSAQQRTYRILQGEEVLQEEFTLPGQSFEGADTLPGRYRAAGYYPQYKFLLGGKIAGNVVCPPTSWAPDKHITAGYSEALRAGLEFGRHSFYTEMRQDAPTDLAKMTAIADFTCPYCGGPAHRDPDNPYYERGFCTQCANAFGLRTAMDCRTYFLSPTLPPKTGYNLTAYVIRPDGRSHSRHIAYHWRPDLYDETDDFLTQSGIAQPTNAPRWVAKHVDQMGDGKGFGKYDSTDSPPFTPGHDVDYFGQLEEIDRDLGLTQIKIVFPAGYSLQQDVELAVDCILADGSTETVPVQLTAGLHGPTDTDPLGDVVLLKPVHKLRAESLSSPYRGVGLYRGVAGVTVTSSPPPQNCRFALVNDNPWLASAGAMAVQAQRRTPTAVQLMPPSAGIELLDDAVGQIYLFYTKNGDIWLTRRRGLAQPWEDSAQITSDGSSSEPAADKDDPGLLMLFRQSGTASARMISRNDGRNWS